MNINVRIRRYHAQQSARETTEIPAWAELIKMSEAEARALADRLSIDWEGRMETLSMINRRRG